MNDEDEVAACALVDRLVSTAIYRVQIPNAGRSPESRNKKVADMRNEVVGHVAVALRAKRLSPAEYDVLTKPIFTRAALEPLTAEERKIVGNVVMNHFWGEGGWAIVGPQRHPETCTMKPTNHKPRWGEAITDVSQDADGRLIASNDEYSSAVNFCPWCGFKGVPW